MSTNDPNPYAAPQATAVAATLDPRAVPLEDDFALGWRIAGGLWLAHGVLLILDGAMSTGAANVFVPAIFDFIVGGGLLGRKPAFVRWGILRAGLGFVFAFTQAGSPDAAWVIVPNLAACAGIGALLVGRPGIPRIVMGCIGFGIFVAVEMLGLAFLALKH